MSGLMRAMVDAIDAITDGVRRNLKRGTSDQSTRQSKKMRDDRDRVQEADGDMADGVPTNDLPDGARETPHRPGDGESSGPVVFYDPKDGATPAQQRQIQEYVNGSNAALRDGYLSPNGRVSTTGELRQQASASAAAERRARHYNGHAGHVPDTTWTGVPDPHSWQDLDPSINQSLGSQSLRYPLGYQPTEFFYGGPQPQ